MNRKTYIWFAILVIVGFFLFMADLALGSVKIPFKEFLSTLFSGDKQSVWFTTLFEFRLPKAWVAVFAGAALSVSGLQMQTLFRNPLAGPYILGISSGAGLGVALLVLGFPALLSFGSHYFLNQWALVIAAWIGSAVILLFIMIVSIRVRDIMTILIFGIMFGSAATALISILQYFGSDASVKAFVIWTMGSLGGVTNNQLFIFIPSILAGLLIALVLPKSLNVLLLGENYARTMGLNVMVTRILIFISTSMLAGTVTAFCGPIGFIGIAIPHIARMLFHTANHFVLVPASILLGMNTMLLSDIISQLPGNATILPITSITALLGIPIVIWIIIKNQKLTHTV
ncbi:MAG: iron ABC transporter permease [Salinivirgaceae bacterium]